jgi:hypothetical protein
MPARTIEIGELKKNVFMRPSCALTCHRTKNPAKLMMPRMSVS